jgi:hypothetical protein
MDVLDVVRNLLHLVVTTVKDRDRIATSAKPVHEEMARRSGTSNHERLHEEILSGLDRVTAATGERFSSRSTHLLDRAIAPFGTASELPVAVRFPR